MQTHSYTIRHKNGWGTGTGPRPTHCHTCGAALPEAPATGATGYGCSGTEPVTDAVMLVECGAQALKQGEHIIRSAAICYQCCGEMDVNDMRTSGRALLYLTQEWCAVYADVGPARSRCNYVSNWPGTLKMRAYVRKGRHNIARTRYDAWFTGPDGAKWHGVQYGENTQVVRCRRLKK